MTSPTANAVTVEDLPLLERRRIEAMVLVPVIRAMQDRFGIDEVNEVVAEAIRGLAGAQSAERADAAGRVTAVELRKSFRDGPILDGALKITTTSDGETSEGAGEGTFGFDVSHCRLVEMYASIGASDLGYLLSCNRDAASFAAMAPSLEFSRTQTRMEGADHCDFRFRPR